MPLNFLSIKMAAWMTILVLAVGSISIVGTAQFVMGLDGDTLKNLLGGCIYGACKDTKITGTQPTPTTGTLIVTKVCVQAGSASCPPFSDFKITVTGNNPSPDHFEASATGTQVTLGPGQYKVSENKPFFGLISFSGDCVKDPENPVFGATGNIKAGETQHCTITNLVG